MQEVLDGVARPARLVDLVELVDADRSAIGPGGPALFQPLFALDNEVPGDETAAAAAVLLTRVTDARQKGELTEAFTTAAVPVLQELSNPAPYRALRTLITDAEREPGRLGSAGSQVLKLLRSISSLPVFDAGNAAQDLLVLVQQDGRVTPAFRDSAIPVLGPLVR